jgi:hypothetical protein
MADNKFLAYQSEIKKILKRILASKRYQIYLFGSRATGTHSHVSDIDLALLADEPIGLELSLAREALEESTIPFTIDLVDLNQTPDSFKQQILKEGILLWKN